MAPERFYFLIPVFAVLVWSFGVFAELVFLGRATARVRSPLGWVMLGVAYSAVLSAYNLSFPLGKGVHLLPVALMAAVLGVALVHHVFALPKTGA
jgi:uncharacterized membrane protein